MTAIRNQALKEQAATGTRLGTDGSELFAAQSSSFLFVNGLSPRELPGVENSRDCDVVRTGDLGNLGSLNGFRGLEGNRGVHIFRGDGNWRFGWTGTPVQCFSKGAPHLGDNGIQEHFSTVPLFNRIRDTGLPPPVNDRSVPSPGGLEVASPSQRLSSFMHKSWSLIGQVVCQAKEEIVSPMPIGGSFASPQTTNRGSKVTKVHLQYPLLNGFYYNGNKDICMCWVATSRVCSVTPNICSYTHTKKARLWAGWYIISSATRAG